MTKTVKREPARRAVKAAPKKVVDPIFAVIAEHRAAQEDVMASCKANGLDVEADPNKVRAMDRASKAELPLFITKPTTLAGVVALLDYVGSDLHKANAEHDVNGRVLTVLAFAEGWPSKTAEAAYRFPRHVAAALRKIAGEAAISVKP
jgi:hypothetical protein